MLYLITKIFYYCNQLYMAPFFAQQHNIDPWMQFFKTLLDKPVPSHLESFVEEMNEIEQRDKSIQWKLKGIAAKLTYRIF